MVESLWQTAYDFKTKRFPQSNCTLIRADYEVELHGSEATGSCVLE